MKFRVLLLALVLGQVLTAAPASAELQLTIRDGRVWLRATNATVRDILAEWAAIGQVRIINAEGLTSEPVTLQLMDVSELQALDVLLRSAAGYIIAERPTGVPSAARFNRIFILPTSMAPRATATSASPAAIPQSSQLTAPPEATSSPQIDGPKPKPPATFALGGPVPPTPFEVGVDSLGCGQSVFDVVDEEEVPSQWEQKTAKPKTVGPQVVKQR
jgi:hypothetical protein